MLIYDLPKRIQPVTITKYITKSGERTYYETVPIGGWFKFTNRRAFGYGLQIEWVYERRLRAFRVSDK